MGVERLQSNHEGEHHVGNRSGKNAIQDSLGAMKRAAERGSDTAEELLSDATERVQRHLVLTVATTFAVGIAAGTLIGLMMKRK